MRDCYRLATSEMLLTAQVKKNEIKQITGITKPPLCKKKVLQFYDRSGAGASYISYIKIKSSYFT